MADLGRLPPSLETGSEFSAKAYCNRCYPHCTYALSPVTLVHPVNADGREEMPFGRDTRVVPH